MKNLWKTCEICEGLFQANRSSQRFCPECGKDSAKARRRLERAERINRSKIGDGNGNLKPQKAVCKECGKEFFSIYGISYCSSLCQYSARVQETRCPVCGKNLFSLGIESGKDIPCSPECKNVYDIRKAKEKGRYKTCLQCGKAFIAHNKKGRFCCQDCWRTYAKAHKKSHTDDDTPSRKKESDAYDKKTCRCCGGTYILSDAW